MRPVLTPEQAGSLDRESQARGITADSLMERAGRHVARAAATVAGGIYGRRAVVVCGKGNNGGDGLVAARALAGIGMRVAVILLGSPQELSGPAAANLARLDEVGLRPRAFEPDHLARELGRADVAVDALFGTGFRGAPEGEWAQAIAALNEGGRPVVAVDIPSGVNGATAAVEGEAVRADLTVTFGAAKVGVILPPGTGFAGLVEVADIGFPPDLVRTDLWLMERADVAALLPERGFETHKRSAGVAVVIGGSRLMTGAVCLSAEAAYRAGAGLVTVAVPEGILPVVQTRLRETTFIPLPETGEGTVAASIERLEQGLEAADAVAIGPGMTTQEETAAYVRTLVRSCPVPVLVDADGLNAFAGRADELADRRSPAVLTPHAGEFARLSGSSAAEVTADRVGRARALAGRTGATVLLKGSRTVVAEPGGPVRVNPTGGPFLATGGTGDVLTGIITGFLAQGMEPADAAACGAYVHGLAGLRAASSRGDGMVAGDLLEPVAEVLEELRT